MGKVTQSNAETTAYVVAIGASAGGLEALQDFLSGFPKNTENLSVIIAQHVSPTHKSMLVQLLSRETELHVSEAADGKSVEPGHVYITPPDKEITVHQGVMLLRKPASGPGPKPSVDALFCSLAEEKYLQTIGVILSGTGSDGAQGVKHLKGAGGYIIVQDPKTAKYNGMPNAAIQSGAADSVLKPDKMGAEILKHIRTPHHIEEDPLPDDMTNGNRVKILSLLSHRTGTDFSNYKSATIGRRLQKRLAMLDIGSIGEYLGYIDKHPDELDEMFKMILIGVTKFFRDPEAFKVLEENLRELINRKNSKDPIRIWVPGCSTGEEAYSVAILLSRLVHDRVHNYNFQIFATDIDDQAVQKARAGIYSEESLKDLDEDIISTYFIRKDDCYELIKPIRSMVLFSKHDITSNPPFLKLDLISCRNLLIYFGSGLQQQIIPLFHYALNQDGLLFLGKSETVGRFTDLFSATDTRNKVFKRKRGGNVNTIRFSAFKARQQDAPEPRQIPARDLSVSGLVKETLYNTYDYPYVVIDEDRNVRETYGDVRLFLTLPSGVLQANLLKMVNPELQMEVRAVITKTIRDREAATGEIRRFELYGKTYYVRVKAKPLMHSGKPAGELFLVIFEQLDIEKFISPGKKQDGEEVSDSRVLELEHELAATKEHLQTYIEEIETSNEELQSLNEELQSTNEELQSSNEELETTNEELQSTNEEIQIAYSELKSVNDRLEQKEELLRQQSDNQQALLNNTLQAFFLIDSSYQIISFNRIAEEIAARLSGKKLKKGYSAVELTLTANLEVFVEELKRAFKGKQVSGERKETDIHKNEIWYSYNLTPVKGAGGEVHVVSLGLIDITEKKQFSFKLNNTERLLHSVFDTSANGICITDEKGTLVDVNSEYCRIYGYSREELIGRNFTMVVPPENRKVLQELHDDFIAGKDELDAEWTVQRSDGSPIEIYASARLLSYEDGSKFKVTSVRDLSENKRYKNLLSETGLTSKIGGWEYDNITGELNWTDEVFSIFEALENGKDGLDLDYMYRFFKDEAGLALANSVNAALQQGNAFDLELEAMDSAEELKWVRITSKPVRVNRKRIKLFGTIQDVTAQRQTQLLLDSSKKQLSLIFENLSDMVFNVAVDSEERFPILNVNEAFCRRTGKNREELIGRPIRVVIPSESYNYVIENYKEAVKSGKQVKWEETVETPQGALTGVVSITPVMDSYGNCTQLIGSINDITERKQAEDTLKNIMDQSLDMICTIDRDGNFVNVSRASEKLLGYKPDELQGKPFMNFVAEEDHLKTAEAATAIIDSGAEVTNFENTYIGKNGEIVPVIWSARFDAEKGLMFAVAKNATEIKKAERIAQQERERYENIFIQFPSYVAVFEGPDHIYQLVNPGYEKLIGKTDIIGRPLMEVVPEVEGHLIVELLDRVLKTGESVKAFEVSLGLSRNGGNENETVFLNFAFIPRKGPDGETIGVYAFGVDVTREVESRRLLEESNERYEYVTRATSEVIWDYEPLTGKLYWGEGFEKLFGLEAKQQEPELTDWQANVHPEDLDKVVKNFENTRKNPKQKKLNQEYRLLKSDGKYAYVEDNAIIIRDKKGQAVRFVGAIKDVTRRKEEEQHLKLLESVVTHANDAVLITEAEPFDNPDGPKIVYVNEAFTRMTGYAPGEVIGKTPRILQGPNSDHKKLRELGKSLRKWESTEIETINYKKNGEEFWINFTVKPVADETGWYTHWIAIERDVTERKNRELQQRLIADISRVFSREASLHSVASESIQTIAKFGDFCFAELWLGDLDQSTMQIAACCARDAGFEKKYKKFRNGQSVKPGEGLAGNVWEEGTYEFISDPDSITCETDSILRESCTNSVYAFPLINNKEVLGVLIFGDLKKVQKQRYFTPLFEEVCSHLAGEIRRKKLEDELYRIFSSAPVIICVAGKDGYFKKVNPAMSQLLGYSEKELLSKPIISFTHPDDKERTEEELNELRNGRGSHYFENRYITKSGSVIWLAWTTRSYPKEGLIYSVAKNVTEQKGLEELLDQVNKLAQIGGWEIDLIGNEVFWSDTTCEILDASHGYEPVYGESLEMCEGESREQFSAAQELAKTKGVPFDLELLVRTKKKKLKWIRSIGKAELVNGKPVRLYGSFQDIHSRKMADITLKKAYEEKNTILESIGEAFFALDADGKVSYWNRVAESLLGIKKEKILNKSIREFFKSRKKDDVFIHLEKALGASERMHFEFYSEQLAKWIDAAAFPSDGGLTMYMRDITGRKQAEEEIRQSNERFEKVTEATNDAIWDWDIVKDKLYRGNGFRKIFGEKVPRTLKSSDFWNEKFYAEDLDRLKDSIKKAIENPEATHWQQEFRIINDEKQIRTVVDRGVIIRDESGKAIRMVGAMSDVTHQKEYEESLRSLNDTLETRARELAVSNAELEQFAYVASHDLQEPLRMISSFLAQLDKKYGDHLDEKAQQYIYFAVDGAKRMRQIILDLLEYSRVGKHEDELDTIDTSKLMDEVVMLQRKNIQEYEAKVTWAKMPKVKSYRSPLVQVLQNLVSNAIKYSKPEMPPEIKVSCRKIKGYWEFSVQDKGIGIEEEYQEKIFIIFQRLHQRNEFSGTGMGLAIVKKNVETLGGTIRVESKPGEGSTFIFTIPRK